MKIFIMKYISNFLISTDLELNMFFHPLTVKLSEALEILAYCLFDGKIDQKSEFEIRLFDELLSEFKLERFKFGFLLSKQFTYRLWQSNSKPNKKKTLALAWIYLKTFGQITKSLCDELFWVFEKEHLKHALACFIFVDDDEDDVGNIENDQLVKNIKMRFDKFLQAEYKGTITEWTKEMYSMVRLCFSPWQSWAMT